MTSSDMDLTHMRGKAECTGFALGVSVIGLVFPACPVPPDS